MIRKLIAALLLAATTPALAEPIARLALALAEAK